MDESHPDNPAPAAPSAVSPQVRLQQLLAIPDKQRTDEQWDELNELEIKLASVNRQGAPQQGAQRQGGAPSQRQDHRGGGGRNNQNNPRNQQGKKFHRRPPRPV
jgi:hypothetical protein